MKKYLFLSMALVSTLAFVGCNTNNPEEEGGVAGQKVKTQFAVNIGSGAHTRMREEIVQATGQQFRGMTSIALATAGEKDATDLGQTKITSWINLGDILSEAEGGEIKNTGTNSSKVYSDVTIPVGTKTLFFYGKAKVATAQGIANGWTNFSPSVTIGNAIENYTFKNKTILTGTELASKDEAVALVAALNAIKDKVDANCEEELQASFFTGNAGSSTAILHRVNDLLATLNDGDHVEAQEAVEVLFVGEENNVNKVFSLNNTTHEASLKAAYKNFPAQYNLPDGAALLSTEGATFAYQTNGNVGNTGTSYVPVSQIVYPAELLYYVASPVKASDVSVENGWQWTANPIDWISTATDKGPLGTHITAWGNEVLATTKTIALANNINYGVAQLKTSVKAGAEELTAKAADNTPVTVAPANVILTGILVGGQPDEVGYNFLTTDATESDMKSAVYDNDLTATAISTSAIENYTLVFDSYIASGSNKVNVALEFKYTGTEPLRARDGIIYQDQKFYLIGQLDATPTDKVINWENVLLMLTPEAYFPAHGKKRVFVQDFTTTANFTVKSLEKAYIGIPDLRSSLIALGLSVDLEWKSGLTFDVTID